MKIKSMVNKIGLQLAFVLMLALTFLPQLASAAAIPNSPCDSLYYETLSARAWLEAQREISQNQNIILKPDSVFEYTCFDKLLYELADHADEMLSETSAYGNPLGTNAMDNALENLVATSLESYASSNFGYYVGSLGGHLSATAIKHTPGSILGLTASPYTCDIMERVWHAAKCINFVSNSSTDGFMSFDEYATLSLPDTDVRLLPQACTGIPLQWAANFTTALTTGPWTNDPVQTYFNETTPENCGASGPCPCAGDEIPTGVQVTRAGVGVTITSYDEHICLQPGCRYHPGGQLSTYGAQPAGCYGR